MACSSLLTPLLNKIAPGRYGSRFLLIFLPPLYHTSFYFETKRKGVPFLEEARKLVLHHHKRYDGTGYPDGLVGDDIPLGARLLSVADSLDSMLSDRGYRSAMSIDDALNELHKCCGTMFCPVAVEALVSAYKSYLKESPLG